MAIPRLRVELELQCRVLNPMSGARDRTRILVDLKSGSFIAEPQRNSLFWLLLTSGLGWQRRLWHKSQLTQCGWLCGLPETPLGQLSQSLGVGDDLLCNDFQTKVSKEMSGFYQNPNRIILGQQPVGCWCCISDGGVLTRRSKDDIISVGFHQQIFTANLFLCVCE